MPMLGTVYTHTEHMANSWLDLAHKGHAYSLQLLDTIHHGVYFSCTNTIKTLLKIPALSCVCLSIFTSSQNKLTSRQSDDEKGFGKLASARVCWDAAPNCPPETSYVEGKQNQGWT